MTHVAEPPTPHAAGDPARPRWTSPARGARVTPRPEVLASAALGLGLVAIFFWKAVFTGQVFIFRDILRVYLPTKAYWAGRILGGGFADWYPFDALGQSLPVATVAGVFHPQNLLFLVLPLLTAMKAAILVNFPIAFVGTWGLTRRFGLGRTAATVSGLLFAFSGYLVCITNNLAYLTAAATVPGALWLADRAAERPTPSRIGAAGLTLALVLLAGDPLAFVMATALAAGVVLVRRGRADPWRGLGIAGVLAATAGLFAAIQILPVLLTLPAIRAQGQTLASAERWSLHPIRLVTPFLGPLFAGYGTKVHAAIASRLLHTGTLPGLWVDSLYLGAPTAALVMVGVAANRRRPATWILAGAVVLVTLLTLGRYTPLYGLAFRYLPLWHVFRFPVKLAWLPTLLLALGAGFGLQAALTFQPWRRRTVLLLGGGALAAAGLASLEALTGVVTRTGLASLWSGPVPEAVRTHLHQGFLRWSLVGVVTAGLFAMVLGGVRHARLKHILLAAVTLAMLYQANAPLYVVGDRAALRSGNALLTAAGHAPARPPEPPDRVYTVAPNTTFRRLPGVSLIDGVTAFLSTAMVPDVGALDGVASAGAYLPAASQRVAGATAATRLWFFRLARLFSVRYLVVDRVRRPGLRFPPDRVVARSPLLALSLLETPAPLPRAYLARPRCVASPDQAMRAVATGTFELGSEAIVECRHPLAAAPPGPLGRARLVSQLPERVEVSVDASAPAVLVLNDAWYPGWRATVDGHPAPILPANALVRAVPVPAGVHDVVFRFRTRGLVLGASLTGASLGLWAVLVLVAAWRRRRTTRAPEPTR